MSQFIIKSLNNKIHKYIYFLRLLLSLLIVYLFETRYLINYETLYLLFFITINILFISNLYII